MRALVVVGIVFFVGITTWAQCPAPNFTVASSGCLDQNFYIQNNSVGATTYEWDFCSGDFQSNPQANPILTNSSLTQAWSVRVVKDQGNWYGFSISVTLNKLFRFDFGSSLNNTPSFTDLGNPSNLINGATDFQLIKEGLNWYGLIPNTNTNHLIRLSFGTSLGSTPTAQDIGTVGSSLNTPNGIVITKDGASTFAFVANGGTSEIVRLDFGTSVTNTPTASVMSLSGGSGLRGIALTKECDRWYGLVLSYGNSKVFSLDFNNGLQQPFQSAQVSFFTAYNFPATVSVNHEGGEYYAFIQSAIGSVYRLSYGTSIIDGTGTGTDLGDLGVSGSNFAQTWTNEGTDWFGFSIDRANGRLIRITLPVTCDANISLTTAETPSPITYSTSGNKKITLKAKDNIGNVQTVTQTVTINPIQSPDIDFVTQNVCANHDVNFTSQNSSQDITDYLWDFGDGGSSASQNPVYQYSVSGDYIASIDVFNSVNGCHNYFEKSISIFDEPTPDFAIPVASPLCINQTYVFDNTSTTDPGYPVTWQWSVNGTPQSVAEDLNFTFTVTSNQDVMLTASIPGCFNNITKSITTLVQGPISDFSFSGQCEDQNVTFTNNSSGTIDGYSWDFDDSSPITSNPNPTHIFSTIGTYDVTLTASNTSTGCNNTKTKSVSVYSIPLVNFLLLPPPFSCNGTPSQFNDLTPTPTDSNIASWSWNFGDAGSSQNTSAIKNPQHTYANAGVYNVSLLVATNFLCSATIQFPVTISQTPVASFNNGPPCEDVPVAFSDTSPGAIQAWNWTIGSSSYTTKNPTHTFINPGGTSATLTVTASNNCIGTTTPKTIVVPAKLSPDFSVAKNCVNQQTVFTDITNGTADPISSHSWSFGTLGTATGSPTTFTFSNIGNVNVTHTVTTQTGCVYPVSKLVGIIQSPQASFTASPLIGAQPLPVQFTNTSVNATSYLWNFADANNSTSTQISPTFTYTTLGTYPAQLTAFNAQNCSHSSSNTIRVVNPMIDVALDGLELMELQNGSFKPAVTIFNNGNVPVNNLSLLIDLAGSAIREHVNSLIMPNTSYRYVFSFEFLYQEGTNYFCIEAEVDDVTPTDDRVCMNFDESITTFPPYPNPTKGEMQVDWIMKEDGIVNLTLVNSMGQEVRSIQVNSNEGLNPFRIDSKGLVTGAYFLKFKYQHFTQVYRVFILE